VTRGLLIVDVQTDFCEGGRLGVEGGNAVAASIAQLLMDRPGLYTHVFASQDWHNAPGDDNGGHFALDGHPDFIKTWPVHCVANTPGSDIQPVLMSTLSQLPAGHLTYVRKGQGRPDYSAFQGRTVNDDWPLSFALGATQVSSLDVVGIATDHCVRASAADALGLLGRLREVRVVSDLCAGVNREASVQALHELEVAGAVVTEVRFL
jgi:nicotinamidase-related amidase